MNKKIKIALFDAKPYDMEWFDKINEKYNFQVKYFKYKLTLDTVALAEGSDVVCVFVNDFVNKTVIDKLVEMNIKLVALRCAGYNNVDLKYIFRKIHTARVPAYSPFAVAEHAFALILSLNRKTHRAYNRTREANFSIAGLEGFDLHEKTLGIIGVGKIGKVMVDIAQGFGMNILVYDKYQDKTFAKEKGFKYTTLANVYKNSDIISLHCPLTSETVHLIDEKAIKKMKEGVMIINTSRGKLIDTQALIKYLKNGKVGAAGLDVYEEESDYFFEDFSNSRINDDTLARLLSFNNVLITSHQAFLTREALSNIATTTLENIKQYFSGGYIDNEICYKCDKGVCIKKLGKNCF